MSAPDDAPKSASKIPLAQRAVTHVAQIGCRPDLPLPLPDSSYGFRDRDTERREAVQDGGTDLELRHLTVKVPRHEALTQQFHTVHLCLDAPPAVIAAPSSPDGATEAARCAQGLVAGDCTRGIGLPGLGVLAGRYDRGSATGSDGFMALAGVDGAISGDAGDLLIGWDLVEQFGQDGRNGGPALADDVVDSLARDFQRRVDCIDRDTFRSLADDLTALPYRSVCDYAPCEVYVPISCQLRTSPPSPSKSGEGTKGLYSK